MTGSGMKHERRLGSFLNDTFALVPKIWKSALPVSLAAILPGAALLAFSMKSLSSLIPFFESQAGGGIEKLSGSAALILARFLPVIVHLLFSMLLLFAGGVFQKSYIIAASGVALDGGKPRFGRTAKICLPACWRIAIQDLAVSFVSQILATTAACAIMIPYVAANIGQFKAEGGSGPVPGFIVTFIGIYLLAILATAFIAWWLKVKAAVAAPASVLEGRNSMAGIGASLDRVRGQSWRVFGIMFIVDLIIGFAVSILSGPFTFATILPGYIDILKQNEGSAKQMAGHLARMFASLGSTLALSAIIEGVIKGGLWPIFLTLLHDDLSSRSASRAEAAKLYAIAGIRVNEKRPAGAAAPVARALSLRAPSFYDDEDSGDAE